MERLTEKKPCRKCLLRDMYPEDYRKYVAGVLAHMRPHERADEAVREARLRRCVDCGQLNNGTCMGCGCLVELRSALRGGTCPYGKWQEKGERK